MRNLMITAMMILSIGVISAIGIFISGGFAEAGIKGDTQSVPGKIAGLNVVLIRTAEEYPCLGNINKHITLRVVDPSIDAFLLDTSLQNAINAEIRQLFGGTVTYSVVGPGISNTQVLKSAAQARRSFALNGCRRLSKETSGEQIYQQSDAKLSTQLLTYPGRAKVVNKSYMGFGSNANAQSVFLRAPTTLGSSQDEYSAYLNNVFSVSSKLLQDGLLFDVDGSGASFGVVVWTDDSVGFAAQPFALGYQPGHDYYFTLSYTNGYWWQCTYDFNIGTSTYECNRSNVGGTGEILGTDNTSVWYENFNFNSNWYQGVTNPLRAWSAAIYYSGNQNPWTAEIQELAECDIDIPSNGAVAGSLKSYGTAYFYLDKIPLAC